MFVWKLLFGLRIGVVWFRFLVGVLGYYCFWVCLLFAFSGVLVWYMRSFIIAVWDLLVTMHGSGVSDSLLRGTWW